jgi:hypothetical protein
MKIEKITIGTIQILSHTRKDNTGEYTQMKDGKVVDFILWSGNEEKASALDNVGDWLMDISCDLIACGQASIDRANAIISADFGASV